MGADRNPQLLEDVAADKVELLFVAEVRVEFPGINVLPDVVVLDLRHYRLGSRAVQLVFWHESGLWGRMRSLDGAG